MTKTRNAYCSFCRRSYRDVGSLVEGPGNVYICAGCIGLCQSIIDQEKRRRQSSEASPLSLASPEFLRAKLRPFVRASEIDLTTLAEAVHSHYDHPHNSQRKQDEKNILLIAAQSLSGAILLTRALARALDVPVAFGHAKDLYLIRTAAETANSIFFKLLQTGDFDTEAVQRGIVFLDGIDHGDTQRKLLEILEHRGSNVFPHEPQIEAHSLLFVCLGSFSGLEEQMARRGRHPEQQISGDDLLAFGVLPALVKRLRAIVRLSPPDEEMAARLAASADLQSFASADKAEPRP